MKWIEANDDKCFFCKGPDPGYSYNDDQGIERAACWKCAKKHAKEKTEDQPQPRPKEST